MLHLRLLLKAVTSKVTIVEKEKFDVEKKIVTVTDKFRTVEKILSCDNLEDFLIQGGYFNLISHIAVLVPFLSGVADRAPNKLSRSLNFYHEGEGLLGPSPVCETSNFANISLQL